MQVHYDDASCGIISACLQLIVLSLTYSRANPGLCISAFDAFFCECLDDSQTDLGDLYTY